MQCRICAKETLFFESATVLRKYRVSYFKCSSCGFIQTEEPHWLQEAYSEAISRSDVGIVERNIELARATRTVISLFFNSKGKFIDYGGGYGLFVRMMRDYGFDFYWHDKYCGNIFAHGFEADTSRPTEFELLTAFEVMEHLSDPIPEIERMLTMSGNVLFTTRILPSPAPKPDQWWYYAVDSGQHLSFYTIKSLSMLAGRLGVKLCSDGRLLHLLTRKNLSSSAFKAVSLESYTSYRIRRFFRKKSLIPRDYKTITGKDL